MYLIPSVVAELQPWLDSNPKHIAARAIRERHRAFVFLDDSPTAPEDDIAKGYYLQLLALRKQGFWLAEREFERQTGRMPTAEDDERVRGIAHRILGPRGFLIARKGANEQKQRTTALTDERLVYAAVISGLSSGRSTYVLTKDEDVQEQFFKLLSLMNTQYRGMHLGSAFASDPSQFVTHSATDIRNVEELFFQDSVLFVERSDEFIRKNLPFRFTFVGLHCFLLRDQLAQLSFGAEMQMMRLVRTKGRTRGLNTSNLGERNAHIWHTLESPKEWGMTGVIARDRRLSVPGSELHIPALDLQQAFLSTERFTRFIEKGDEDDNRNT